MPKVPMPKDIKKKKGDQKKSSMSLSQMLKWMKK